MSRSLLAETSVRRREKGENLVVRRAFGAHHATRILMQRRDRFGGGSAKSQIICFSPLLTFL